MDNQKDYFGISGTVYKTVFVIIGIIFTVKSFIDIFMNSNNNYTSDDLLKDINDLNEISHGHSIVIIKDTFKTYPNRYLVYYDRRWNCELFLNYKENPNNENFIISHLSSELKVNYSAVQLKYVGQRIHQKYSVSAKKEKVYNHRFYLANISDIPSEIQADTFEIDGKCYFWRTISDLEQNIEVQKKNADVLGFVKELF